MRNIFWRDRRDLFRREQSGALFAADAVESDIVGYKETTLTQDEKQQCGVCFKGTASEPYDIQQIVCKNGKADPADGQFKLYWWDVSLGGYVYASYSNDAYADDGEDDGYGTEYTDKFYWVTDDDDVFILAPLGWKHDAEAPATIVDHAKIFQPGEGFWIKGGCANPVMTIAGGVKELAEDIEFASITLTQDEKQQCTNPFPVVTDIQDIVCKNGTADPADGQFKLYWWDVSAGGYVYASYSNDAYADDGEDDGYGTEYTDRFYWVTDDDDVFILAPLGWKHDDAAPATIADHGKSFDLGEGFWIKGGCATPVVKFANPAYKD